MTLVMSNSSGKLGSAMVVDFIELLERDYTGHAEVRSVIVPAKLLGHSHRCFNDHVRFKEIDIPPGNVWTLRLVIRSDPSSVSVLEEWDDGIVASAPKARGQRCNATHKSQVAGRHYEA